MTTYLVGTDGVEASEAIGDYLDGTVDHDDQLVVVNVLTAGADADERRAGEAGLNRLEERLGDDTELSTHQLSRGRSPTEELLDQAQEVDADELLVALRRHSRTERIIFGSVSHALLQEVVRPITLVPLPEYTPES